MLAHYVRRRAMIWSSLGSRSGNGMMNGCWTFGNQAAGLATLRPADRGSIKRPDAPEPVAETTRRPLWGLACRPGCGAIPERPAGQCASLLPAGCGTKRCNTWLAIPLASSSSLKTPHPVDRGWKHVLLFDALWVRSTVSIDGLRVRAVSAVTAHAAGPALRGNHQHRGIGRYVPESVPTARRHCRTPRRYPAAAKASTCSRFCSATTKRIPRAASDWAMRQPASRNRPAPPAFEELCFRCSSAIRFGSLLQPAGEYDRCSTKRCNGAIAKANSRVEATKSVLRPAQAYVPRPRNKLPRPARRG